MDTEKADAIALVVKNGQGELVVGSDIQNLEQRPKDKITSNAKRLEDKINDLRWNMIVVAGVVVALIKLTP